MSTIFDNKDNKAKCQKFTPEELVEEMLSLAGYTHCLVGKRVLENSFGSGNILVAIVKRYIEESIAAKIPVDLIARNLEMDIFGIELDEDLFAECVKRLNDVVTKYGLPNVKWSLFNQNALNWETDVKFDYIIGNPPYITYKDMDGDSRKSLRERFESCANGKFDYCYAFIECGVKLLSDTGKLVQLVPSNIYKNVFGKNLRSILLPHISVIIEYPGQELFDNTLTSSTVFLFDKSYSEPYITYTNSTANKTLKIMRDALGEKWVFSDIAEQNQKMVRFGDCFHASSVVATLLNEAFLLPPEEERNIEVERAVVKSAASPRKLRRNIREDIIFPYFYEERVLRRYTTAEFEQLFPNAVEHLTQYLQKLNNRDADDNVAWFEYGRTQALARLNQPKLLMSTVVTNRPEIYELDEDTIPYSGIFITAKQGNTLDEAKRILNDKHFVQYVESLGVSISGKSKRITSKDVNEYRFVKE